MHPQERTFIEKLAKQKAAQTCGGDTQCHASAITFWIDALERVAKGAVDDGDNAKNVAYVSTLLSAAKNPNSEGALSLLENYLDGLKEAQTMLAPYTGKTIATNGQVAQSDGAAQTYFSATAAQRADDWSNRFLGEVPGPIVPGVQMRDADRLERFSALNGSVKPDYTVEELLLGGAVQSRLVGAAGRLISDLEVLLSGRTVSSISGNISARQITEAGMQATLTSAERDLLRQAAEQSNSSLRGKVSEYVSDSYFARNGYKQIEGKCGSDNCFDAVFIKGDKVYVVESKPLQSNGAIKLSPTNSITGLPAQMTDEWVGSAISRLGLAESSEAAQTTAKIIAAARNKATLVKLVVGSNKDGITIVRLK